MQIISSYAYGGKKNFVACALAAGKLFDAKGKILYTVFYNRETGISAISTTTKHSD
jgi:hypothetical protein